MVLELVDDYFLNCFGQGHEIGLNIVSYIEYACWHLLNCLEEISKVGCGSGHKSKIPGHSISRITFESQVELYNVLQLIFFITYFRAWFLKPLRQTEY